MKKKTLQHEIVSSIREIIFGLEDALVSTLGAVTGIAVGTGSQYVVILSGLVLIAAESMSMGAGSYLSSKSAAAAEGVIHKKKTQEETPVRAGVVMFVFYFFGGFIPLLPYMFMDTLDAILPSVVFTGITLFLLGVWASKYTKRSAWKSGMEMMLISLAAALVGYLIGRLVSSGFGVDIQL
ncbi:MAG: VIT1/CCC1 transporter family protein [bacterium]|nr:VIT1/CCC1 transporter family protein [bacterium]